MPIDPKSSILFGETIASSSDMHERYRHSLMDRM
jgi:hypothetical protein